MASEKDTRSQLHSAFPRRPVDPSITRPTAIMGALAVRTLFWSMGMTSVDRRKCERTVPMEVLVLGMSRTGTSSLRQALKKLGYNDTYHAGCVYNENPRDSEMWVDAYRAKFHGEGKPFEREEFDKLLGHCMAVTDVPALHFKEELAAAYPNARIVLSIRDSPAAWLKSMRTTLIPFAKRTYDTSLWSRVYRLFLPRLPFQQMNDEMMYLSSLEEFEKTDESEYIKHSEAVKELAKEHDMQILEFNVKSGWAPLAEFLGKEVPKDEQGEPMPFPRVNDSANFNEKMAVLNKVMNILVAVNVVCTTLGTYALVKGGLWAWGQYGDEILRRLSVR